MNLHEKAVHSVKQRIKGLESHLKYVKGDWKLSKTARQLEVNQYILKALESVDYQQLSGQIPLNDDDETPGEE